MTAYRNDLDAAKMRVEKLEAELEQARAGKAKAERRVRKLKKRLREQANGVDDIGLAERIAADDALLVRPTYESSNANIALVFGILSLTVCAVFGPVAWVKANEELQRIEAGRVDPTTLGTVRVARGLGIASSVLLGLAILWFVFVVGM